MVPKKDIRKQIFSLRKQVTEDQVQKMSLEITRRIISMPAFKRAARLFVYMDYNHEVITRYLIEEAWKSGKEVAVPKVCGDHMIFYKISDFQHMEKSNFGIPEPIDAEPVDWPDALMIMPGVAFDREVHRVGYGGGFYDRYLAAHPDVQRLAVAFSFQILEQVPSEPTDICPQILVTENEVLYQKDH